MVCGKFIPSFLLKVFKIYFDAVIQLLLKIVILNFLRMCVSMGMCTSADKGI